MCARAAGVSFRYLLEVWPEPGSIQVLCGTGNNGGDGFLVADLAHKRGIEVSVVQLGDPGKISGDAQLARKQALDNGVPRQSRREALAAEVASWPEEVLPGLRKQLLDGKPGMNFEPKTRSSIIFK